MTRDLSIDRLRGALVILMVIGDYIAGVNWIPNFLKHADDIGFTIADTVAPAFVFVIGLNFRTSYLRRAQDGKAIATRYFTLRYLSILGIGAIITGGATLVDRSTGWGVLESLGIAGLLTLTVIRLPTWVRFVIGFVILCGYQYVLDLSMLDNVLSSGHGGFFGAISWSALLILSTAVSDVWHKGINKYLLCTVALSVAAAISIFLVPVSKNRVSLSYILLTLAMTAVAFLIIKILSRRREVRSGLLTWWGQNALAMYVVHLLVLSVFGLPDVPWWYADVQPWLLLIQLAAIIGFMTFVANKLVKRKAFSH